MQLNSTTSTQELVARYGRFLRWLEGQPVKVRTRSRLRRYEKQLQRLVDSLGHPERLKSWDSDFGGITAEVAHLSELGRDNYSGLIVPPSKLELLQKGTSLALQKFQSSNTAMAREVSWEMFAASQIQRTGYKVDYRDKGADLYAHAPNQRPLLIECKRPLSIEGIEPMIKLATTDLAISARQYGKRSSWIAALDLSVVMTLVLGLASEDGILSGADYERVQAHTAEAMEVMTSGMQLILNNSDPRLTMIWVTAVLPCLGDDGKSITIIEQSAAWANENASQGHRAGVNEFYRRLSESWGAGRRWGGD